MMPYMSRKIKNKNCCSVYNKKTKRRFSKCTTKKNATRQLRLLRALLYNKKFVPNSNYTRKNKK